ncbi:MAG: FliM/FliN family flagellar motor switch protein [Novosphingobium sp.]|nr:FliM/FliN family flagellar motor switch protein [Novosphingobium sp.]
MKPGGPFVAERVAAQHCPELLQGKRQAANPLKELARLGERLPEQLERQLAALCPGAKVEVRAGEPAELHASAANDRRAEPVLNSMLAVGPKEVMMIASVPRRAVLGLVDLALGGTGKEWDMPAGKLPLSARLMFGRVEKMLAGVLAGAMDLSDPELVKPKNAGAALEANTPFAGCRRTVLPVEVAIAGTETWELVFVFPGSSVAALFANQGEAKGAAPAASRPAEASPQTEPFGGIPLPLKAVLVDMAVPVSMLSRLKPGMVIPVTVARSVPLIAGEQAVAHGSVGAVDDRAALQLTRITAIKEN